MTTWGRKDGRGRNPDFLSYLPVPPLSSRSSPFCHPDLPPFCHPDLPLFVISTAGRDLRLPPKSPQHPQPPDPTHPTPNCVLEISPIEMTGKGKELTTPPLNIRLFTGFSGDRQPLNRQLCLSAPAITRKKKNLDLDPFKDYICHHHTKEVHYETIRPNKTDQLSQGPCR
jgi:hypothetical protein